MKRLALLLTACTLPLSAQTMTMSAHTLLEAEEQHATSGTSLEPASTPAPMLMTMRGPWMLMVHGNAFLANEQQQADNHRGRDAWFSTNWIMPMAQRKLGERGTLTLRTMFSLEPATVGRRNYPELFQQGETAHGAPIIDGQHPHDFLMEAAALYDLKLSENILLSLYAAPVGDPALGPTAYPHRLSASEDPIAALGHHQQDSTHIAFNVLTGGLTWKWARVELSGFHGGEPTEAHWHPEPSANGHAIDSVSTRLTLSPTPDWTGQYSLAHITSPEALYPGEDQQRQTASIMYHHAWRAKPAPQPAMHHDMPDMKMCNMPGMDMSSMHHDDMASMPGMDHSTTRQHDTAPMPHTMPMHMEAEPRTDLSLTALWGRTRSLADNSKQNSYLFEALLRFARSNYAWTRLENAGRSNELLLAPGSPLPANFTEQPIGHVAAFTFGYDHDIALGRHLLAAPGAQITAYHAPRALAPTYGTAPTGEVFFVRFRLR